MAVDSTTNIKGAFKLLNEFNYDCLVLDLNLPDGDGAEISRSLKSKNCKTPILMLTAKSSKDDLVDGYKDGADDYLAKPFDYRELILRINSLIMRNNDKFSNEIRIQDLCFNLSTKRITKNGAEIILNNKEFGILEYLILHKGKIVSQEELLEHVWDHEMDMFSKTVRTNIKTLRKKVDINKTIIKTVIGRGYFIDDQNEDI